MGCGTGTTVPTGRRFCQQVCSSDPIPQQPVSAQAEAWAKGQAARKEAILQEAGSRTGCPLIPSSVLCALTLALAARIQSCRFQREGGEKGI